MIKHFIKGNESILLTFLVIIIVAFSKGLLVAFFFSLTFFCISVFVVNSRRVYIAIINKDKIEKKQRIVLITTTLLAIIAFVIIGKELRILSFGLSIVSLIFLLIGNFFLKLRK
jgi:ABC-type spermidine/putrescine transport system permease subunit II